MKNFCEQIQDFDYMHLEKQRNSPKFIRAYATDNFNQEKRAISHIIFFRKKSANLTSYHFVLYKKNCSCPI